MKVALFSCGDNNFIIPSIVALKSMEKNLRGVEVDLFYIGSKEGAQEKDLKELEKNKIDFIDFNSKNIFHPSKRWPKEAFWYMLGPEYFFSLGYEYSLYVDGDTLTLNPIDGKDIFKECSSVTAVKDYFDNENMIGEGVKNILKTKKVKFERLKKPNLNSGVIYFNNRYFYNIKFIKVLKKELEFLNKINAYKGLYADQGLMCYLDLMEIFDIKFISKNYNFLLHQYQFRHNLENKEIKTIHFIGSKPWKKPYSYRQRPHSIELQEIWVETALELGISKIGEVSLNNLKQAIFIEFLRKSFFDKIWKQIWYIKHKKRKNLLD